MDTQKENGQTADGYGDESLNTASTGDQQSGNSEHQDHKNSEHQDHKKGGIHNNALYAAGMGRPATAQVDPHSNSGLAQTGTNISYEGATAAGSGGSSGTGYTSGQADTGASISTDTDFDQAAVSKHFDKVEGDDDVTDDNAGTAEDSKR